MLALRLRRGGMPRAHARIARTGCALELWNVRGGWIAPPSNAPECSEGELEPELYHAAASRTNQRIAGYDVGCAATAAERAGGAHVIGSARRAASAVRCAPRIGDDWVIEDVKELDPE